MTIESEKQPWEMTSAEYNAPFLQHGLDAKDVEALKKIRDAKAKPGEIYPNLKDLGLSKKDQDSLRKKGLIEKGFPILSIKARIKLLQADGVNPWAADEYSDLPMTHKTIVKRALEWGMPVPEKVRAEYPGLSKQEITPWSVPVSDKQSENMLRTRETYQKEQIQHFFFKIDQEGFHNIVFLEAISKDKKTKVRLGLLNDGRGAKLNAKQNREVEKYTKYPFDKKVIIHHKGDLQAVADAQARFQAKVMERRQQKNGVYRHKVLSHPAFEYKDGKWFFDGKKYIGRKGLPNCNELTESLERGDLIKLLSKEELESCILSGIPVHKTVLARHPDIEKKYEDQVDEWMYLRREDSGGYVDYQKIEPAEHIKKTDEQEPREPGM
jgi:hypothetical protein